MLKVFVSYSHQQDKWVWGRLIPVLKAAGVEVLNNRECFRAGKSVVGQMDAVQDRAQRQLLVLSDDYLKSPYCSHELHRALATDPDFSRGTVVPVKRHACTLPTSLAGAVPLAGPNPLLVDLQDESQLGPWTQLLDACNAELGTNPPHWLEARDKVAQLLRRGESVNLVVSGRVRWRALIDHLRAEHVPELAEINLERGSTKTQRGLVEEILSQLGYRATLPKNSNELVELDRLIGAGPQVRVALIHFDRVRDRRKYDIDLFAALRGLMQDGRKLVLLIESRAPIASLLPPTDPISGFATDIKTVTLRGNQ